MILYLVQMSTQKFDGNEIKMDMRLVTDNEAKMYAFSLSSMYIVAD